MDRLPSLIRIKLVLGHNIGMALVLGVFLKKSTLD
jgi:hypothetical protein